MALSQWLGTPEMAPPGGESMVQLAARVAEAQQRILAANAGKSVLIVAHVGSIKMLVREALGAPISTIHRLQLAPASLCTVRWYADGNSAMHAFNETSTWASGRGWTGREFRFLRGERARGRPPDSPWLNWARKLDAMARIGSTFASNPYETRRYTELASISRAMLAELCGRPEVEMLDMYHPSEGYVTPKVDVRAAVFDDRDGCSWSARSPTDAGRCRAAGPTSGTRRRPRPSGRCWRSPATSAGSPT